MNILLYVFALLSIIAMITYARIQATLSSVGLRIEYANTIQEKEREEINALQEKQYQKHKGKRKPNEKKKIDASSYLNFIVFTDKTAREGHQVYFKNAYEIASRLIEILYQNTPFYQTFNEEYGNPADILLQQILIQTENHPITQTDDLKTLDLHNTELQELFAKMLEGGEETIHNKKAGYRSLLDFIQIQPKIQPIRVQRVPQELLQAIYIDPELTDEILQKREELRLQSGAIGTTEQQVSSHAFESLYKIKLPKSLNKDSFNFSVTKSPPR